MIGVRAFGPLDALGGVLAAYETVTVHEVTWHIDWDNPAWPGVRAAAVQAAITKGRDYAAALGGSLRGVEHIANAGLLGGGDTPSGFTGRDAMVRAASRGVTNPMRPRSTRFPRNWPPSSKPASPPTASR